MFFAKPTIRAEKRTGITESYHLETENIKFSIDTIVGGWEKFDAVNEDRFVYVLRGSGEARVNDGTNYALEEGVHFVVPRGTGFSVQDSQLRYVLVRGNADFSIAQNNGDNKLTVVADETTLVYVLEGFGSLMVDGRHSVLNDGSFAEISAGTTFELNGNLKYILVRGK